VAVRTPGTALKGASLRHARTLVDILRARLLQLPGGELVLPAAQAAPAQARAAVKTQIRAAPPQAQLEAVLDADGPKAYAWWRAGVDAARSVGVVRQRLGQRTGIGFLVRAGDFFLGGELPAAAPLLMTNHHVVNPDGMVLRSLRPDQAEVVFMAVDPAVAYKVTELLWCSPLEQHDARCCAWKQHLPAWRRCGWAPSFLPCRSPSKRSVRACTSWATPAGVSCHSAFMTTRCSTTKCRSQASRNAKE